MSWLTVVLLVAMNLPQDPLTREQRYVSLLTDCYAVELGLLRRSADGSVRPAPRGYAVDVTFQPLDTLPGYRNILAFARVDSEHRTVLITYSRILPSSADPDVRETVVHELHHAIFKDLEDHLTAAFLPGFGSDVSRARMIAIGVVHQTLIGIARAPFWQQLCPMTALDFR